jgi:long-subunit fatty acid transport protein
MKKISKWIVFCLMLGLAGQALAQGEYPFLLFGRNPFTDLSFLGAGARAHGMGGAFYAVSDDPTALTWNPAGLVQMDKSQMSVAFHHTRAENDYSGNYIGGSSFSGKPGQSVDQLAFAGVVIPFDLKGRHFVGSASIPNSVSEIRGSDFRDGIGFSHDLNGRLSMASLGLATKIWRELSLGLAVNIYGHGYDRNGHGVYKISDPSSVIDTVLNYHPRIKSGFSGWNVTLGGMLKMEKLRLAAVFKSPFTEQTPLTEDLDVQSVTDMFIGGVKNPSNNRAFGLLYKTKSKWILPGIFGLGASYQVTENLLIAADFDIKPYSKAWIKMQSNLLDPSSNFEAFDLKWKDCNQFRMGGEYKVRVSRFTIPVRAGYRNDPKPFENVDNLYALVLEDPFGQFLSGRTGIYFGGSGSQVKGNVVSFGSGVAFGQVAFDVTWEFESYDYEENGVILTNQLELFPFSRSSNISSNRVIFNFTGVF